ncbi:MAG: hypothetical protein JSW33_15810 [bacterium]|nr:MAG: hypothetical protein JSW33_15810 [bacterium]
MINLVFRNSNLIFLLVIIGSILIGCFKKVSETVRDESAGINGGFEVIKSGLPVNWLIYSPKTIPTGNYDLILDTVEYVEGKQSLKFLVHECSAMGGWYSPGFCNEFKAIPAQMYKISFWIKNDGCEFMVRIGGVGTKIGKYEIIVNSKESYNEWKYFEYDYKMPAEEEYNRLRLETSILHPGNFQIDDIKIADIHGESVVPII